MAQRATTWNQQYLNTLSNGLERLLSSGSHSDTTIVVEGQSFQCHRAILASMSPYFDAMFSSGMRESVTGEVTMQGISAEIFKSIINYIYSGFDIVTDDNAFQVLHASAILQIECLMRRSEDFVCKKVTDANCVEAYRKAVAFNCAQLKQKSKERMLLNFDELRTSNEFHQLDVEEVIMMIKDDNLHCPNEEYVCDALVDWVSHDIDNRKKHIGALFKHVRLPLTKSDYLVDVLEKHEFIKADADCQRYIDVAKNFHLLPSRRHDYSAPNKCYRLTSDMDDVLVLLSGGETARPPYIRSKDVLAYSFNKKKWFHLAQLPFDPGIEFASCVYGNDILVTGGGQHPKCFMRYRAAKNKWSMKGPKLNSGRRRHAMVTVGNKIYVIGGFNSEQREGSKVLNVIEQCSSDESDWHETTKLNVPVSSVSAAVLVDKIYIFGGETNGKADTNSIQCFDTRLKTMSIIGCLPMSCKLTRAVVCDDSVYIVLYDGKVLKYSKGETCDVVGRIPKFERVHFGLVHTKGSLYIMGGQFVSGPAARVLCNYIGKYDLRNNSYSQLSDTLPTARLLDSCAKISIAKKFLVEEELSD